MRKLLQGEQFTKSYFFIKGNYGRGGANPIKEI
jgi:hypothetical protein